MRKFLSLLLCMFILTGCNGSREPEERDYVMVVAVDKNYDTYFGWPEGKCTFKVEDLSYSSLRLEYEGTKSIFRKF